MVAIIGLSANLMSVVVLVRPKIRSVAFNQLLVVLCVVDSLFLCCNSLSMGHALGLDKSKYILSSSVIMNFRFGRSFLSAMSA